MHAIRLLPLLAALVFASPRGQDVFPHGSPVVAAPPANDALATPFIHGSTRDLSPAKPDRANDSDILAKQARATKRAAESSVDAEDDDTAAVPVKRARKASVDAEDDDTAAVPVKRARKVSAAAAEDDDADASDASVAPTRRVRKASAASAKEDDADADADADDTPVAPVKRARKVRAASGRSRKAIKGDSDDDDASSTEASARVRDEDDVPAPRRSRAVTRTADNENDANDEDSEAPVSRTSSNPIVSVMPVPFISTNSFYANERFVLYNRRQETCAILKKGKHGVLQIATNKCSIGADFSPIQRMTFHWDVSGDNNLARLAVWHNNKKLCARHHKAHMLAFGPCNSTTSIKWSLGATNKKGTFLVRDAGVKNGCLSAHHKDQARLRPCTNNKSVLQWEKVHVSYDFKGDDGAQA